MSEQLLNHVHILSALQWMGCKRMAQGIGDSDFVDSCRFYIAANRFLHQAWIQMVSRLLVAVNRAAGVVVHVILHLQILPLALN